MTARLFSQSLNLQWAAVIIHTLVHNGIRTFFVSPGNRNLPLIAAIVDHPGATGWSCVDERAAAYRALGFAKATGLPGALVCTSGTALANYFPAVIEAYRDEVPMIVISADRPPELVECDANQTINQVGFFERFSRESLALPCPTPDVPPPTLVSDIAHISRIRSGPVHINCPFREPLIPAPPSDGPDTPPAPEYLGRALSVLKGTPVHHRDERPLAPAPGDLDHLASVIRGTRRGLLVVGRLNFDEEKAVLAGFIRKLNWPTFCDISSGLKSFVPASRRVPLFDHPEALRIMERYAPDTVLQFGTGLVSKHYTQSVLPMDIRHRIMITPRQGLRDPSRRMQTILKTRAHTLINALGDIGGEVFDAVAADRCAAAFTALARAMEKTTTTGTLNYPVIARIILRHLPENEGLFLGNSITIRAFDAQPFPAFGKKVHVASNRGVSGIEGNLATAIGFAQGKQARVTAVMGDISFLHDLNSLMLLGQSPFPVILVLINNQGGRIFERLPVRHHPDIMSPGMTTPHSLEFKHAADLFCVPYAVADTPDSLASAYTNALEAGVSRLIEVRLSPELDLAAFDAVNAIRLNPNR